MTNRSYSSFFHRILNIISLILTFSGLIITFLILIRIYFQRKHFFNIKSLLCINNYFLVFLLGIVHLIQIIDIFKADFGFSIIQYETLGCRIKGYILFSLLSAIYQAFILQALFRLDRIVHRSHRWFIKFSNYNYLIIIPILWLISFILMSPLLIFHSQKLISGEYVCLIPKDDSFSIAYATLIIYVIPLLCIIFIYFRVSIYLHNQSKSNKQLLIIKNHRDILVIRRILILVILLFSYGFPQSLMLVHLAITNELISSFYRFLLLSISGCVFTQSIIIIYVTPHFKRNIFYFQRTEKRCLINQRKYSQTKTNTTYSNSSNIIEHSF